ncbi:PEP-CTERM sorting domain-containing protein [Roseiarcus fermentans]|nr:PEP-CTERM sorting domain-containing protein [Roseiarcus fermentans]
MIVFAGTALADPAPVYGDQTVTIPVANVSNGQFTGSPQISVAFGSGSASDMVFGPSQLYTMDTGSTGVAVDTSVWTPEGTNLGSGSVYYSSSKLEYTGTWYAATLQVGDAQNNATVSVPVLSVSGWSTCTQYPQCTANAAPPHIAYFGVGFAREANSEAQINGKIASIPADNPLLNITQVNGVTVTASTPAGAGGATGDYTSGYILTPQGVTLGLTAANTANFALTSVAPWLDVPQDDYADWSPISGTLTYNGVSIPNTKILPDTGIEYMFATPGTGAPVHPLTSIQVQIGSGVTYAFDVGSGGVPAPGSPPAAPPWVDAYGGSAPFVNTGYHFFNQYKYMYDYVNGNVGFAEMTAPAPEASTWLMILIGFGGAGVAGRAARRAPAAA